MPFLEPGSVIVLASVGKTEPVTGFQERNYQAIGFKGWPPQLPHHSTTTGTQRYACKSFLSKSTTLAYNPQCVNEFPMTRFYMLMNYQTTNYCRLGFVSQPKCTAQLRVRQTMCTHDVHAERCSTHVYLRAVVDATTIPIMHISTQCIQCWINNGPDNFSDPEVEPYSQKVNYPYCHIPTHHFVYPYMHLHSSLYTGCVD
jgi:hypothetical protein